jgi:hypothetical protein
MNELYQNSLAGHPITELEIIKKNQVAKTVKMFMSEAGFITGTRNNTRYNVIKFEPIHARKVLDIGAKYQAGIKRKREVKIKDKVNPITIKKKQSKAISLLWGLIKINL